MLCPLLRVMTQKTDIYELGSESLSETEFVSSLVFNILLSRTVSNNWLLFVSYSNTKTWAYKINKWSATGIIF